MKKWKRSIDVIAIMAAMEARRPKKVGRRCGLASCEQINERRVGPRRSYASRRDDAMLRVATRSSSRRGVWSIYLDQHDGRANHVCGRVSFLGLRLSLGFADGDGCF